MVPRYSRISDAAAVCRQIFEECTTEPYLMEDEWAEERLADFNLWSNGAGASAGGRASLDYRLGSEPDVKDVIINLLRMLITLLEKSRTIAQDMEKARPMELPHLTTALPGDSEEALLVMHTGVTLPVLTECMDSSTMAQKEMLKQNSQEVRDVLKEMIRLTSAIRKSGFSSRFQKADSQFKPGDHKKLNDHLQFILTACPSRNSGTTFLLDPSKFSTIQRRLIEANLRRRNRFLYQQKHSEKLAIRQQFPTVNLRVTIIGIWYAAKRWIFTLFQRWFLAGTPTQPPCAQETRRSETLLSSTSASEVKTPINAQKSKSVSTVVSSTITAIEYPEPPQPEPGNMVFKCPCCCQYLSVETAQKSRWRKHLSEDIQPYTCILEDCPRPWNLFPTRDLWMKHMKTEHKSIQYWRCPDICCSNRDPIENEDEFISHLQNDHSESISKKDMRLLISACARAAPAEIKTCPLCPSEAGPINVDASILLKHIAMHMHAFSLKSLPEPPEEHEYLHQTLFGGDDYFLKNPYFDISGKVGSAAHYLDTLSDRSSAELEPPIFDDNEEQDSVLHSSEEPILDKIKCPCGYETDDGRSILCEECRTRQHVLCYYDNEDQIPQVHECTDCKPRILDQSRIMERQEAFKSMSYVAETRRTTSVATSLDHSSIFTNAQYWCPFCNTKTYKSKGNLNNHVEQHHEPQKHHLCNECKSSWTTALGYSRHLRRSSCSGNQLETRNHELKKSLYACGICARVFDDFGLRQDHLFTHQQSGMEKSSWNMDNVMLGLLSHPPIAGPWNAAVQRKYNYRDPQWRPRWDWNNPQTGEVLVALEYKHYHSIEDLEKLLDTAIATLVSASKEQLEAQLNRGMKVDFGALSEEEFANYLRQIEQ